MNIRYVFVWSILMVAVLMRAQAGDWGVKKVNISAYNTLKFSESKIEVHPGQTVELTLTNQSYLPRSAMEHCWVLLKAGIDPVKYADELVKAEKDQGLAASLKKEILVSTKDLGPQETDIIRFTAPNQPGSYPYMCDSPMHCQDGMRGTLVVK